MRPVGDPESHRLWAGVGNGLALAADLVGATVVWAAIGYGLDRLFDTWPVLFVIGAVVGNVAGVYVLYRRSTEAVERARPGRK